MSIYMNLAPTDASWVDLLAAVGVCLWIVAIGAFMAHATFARGGSNVIRFEADPTGNSSGSVSVSAESADVGKNSGDLDATIEGEQAFIAFNARFLGECLGTIDTEEVEVQLSGATSPGLIRPLGDESYTHVIMPMHTVR